MDNATNVQIAEAINKLEIVTESTFDSVLAASGTVSVTKTTKGTFNYTDILWEEETKAIYKNISNKTEFVALTCSTTKTGGGSSDRYESLSTINNIEVNQLGRVFELKAGEEICITARIGHMVQSGIAADRTSTCNVAYYLYKYGE